MGTDTIKYHYKFAQTHTFTTDAIDVTDHGSSFRHVLRPCLFEDYEKVISRPKYVNAEEWKRWVEFSISCAGVDCILGESVSLYIDVIMQDGVPGIAKASVLYYDEDDQPRVVELT